MKISCSFSILWYVPDDARSFVRSFDEAHIKTKWSIFNFSYGVRVLSTCVCECVCECYFCFSQALCIALTQYIDDIQRLNLFRMMANTIQPAGANGLCFFFSFWNLSRVHKMCVAPSAIGIRTKIYLTTKLCTWRKKFIKFVLYSECLCVCGLKKTYNTHTHTRRSLHERRIFRSV